MKGDKVKCQVCKKEFVKRMFTQVNCSRECATKSSMIKQIESNKVNKFKIFERDGFKCFYCGKTSIEDNGRLLLDHVIPLSKRGETNKENLVTCCTECNASKGGMMIKGERLIQIQDEIKRRNS